MSGRAAGPGKSGAILDIFTRHVAEKGYDGTSFSDVASELGISQGLIVHLIQHCRVQQRGKLIGRRSEGR